MGDTLVPNSLQGWIKDNLILRGFGLQLLNSRDGGYLLAAILAVLLPLARILLKKFIFEPWGRAVLYKQAKKADSSQNVELQLRKWNESCWKASFYFVTTATGVYAVWNERFVTDTKYFWIGCNRFPPCNYDVSPLLRFIYSLQLGFYLQAVPYLIFAEVRRKDFWQNFGHHIATIGLIVYSYHVNFMKIGIMVFLCHDVNDIFLEGAKVARYAKNELLTNGLMGVFVLSWFSSRMYYFPAYVIRSVWNEPLEIIANVYGISPHPHHEIFLGLLLFLFTLHCYWAYLILRIVARQLKTGSVDDIREDDSDDD